MNMLLEKIIQKQRKDFIKLTLKQMETHTFPDDVVTISNVPYSTDTLAEHCMDIYRPANTQRTLPVIINVHGGGLILGNKEFNRHYCAQLCKLGFVVFSIEYRLIPEITVFQQFSDIINAMDFINPSVLVYGGDPTHIYMVGDSAGAYLITYTVAMQKSPSLAEAAYVVPSSLQVRVLGLVSGMFYTRRFDEIGIFLPKLLYGKDYKSSNFYPYTNPEHDEIINSLPPCYLITSNDDKLHHYTTDFAAALKRNHRPFELLDYPADKRLVHAFSIFEPTMDKSLEATEKMTDFLLHT